MAVKKMVNSQKRTKNKRKADFDELDDAIAYVKQNIAVISGRDNFRGVSIKGVSIGSSGEELTFKDI